MQQYLNKLENMDELIRHYFLPFSFKILGAFAIWIIGGFFIRIIQRILKTTLHKRLVDSTLINYANATSAFVLKAFLILAILGVFGIETTSLSALLAATGVAIGMAWSGLLSNFAAGIFLIVLRPFKVGDAIAAAGVSGVVREIGMFATTLDTADNLRIFVGNNKIFSDNIQNYSANPFRVIAYRIQLASITHPLKAIEQFAIKLQTLPHLKAPVTGEIAEFNALGVVIVMKTACTQDHYNDLMSAGNRIIFETMQTEHYPVAQPRYTLARE